MSKILFVEDELSANIDALLILFDKYLEEPERKKLKNLATTEMQIKGETGTERQEKTRDRETVVNAAFLFFETSKLWALICIFIDRWKAEGLSQSILLREPFESLLVKPFILGKVDRPQDVKV